MIELTCDPLDYGNATFAENTSLIDTDLDEMNQLDHESMDLTVIFRMLGFIPIYVIIFLTGILGNSLVIAAILRLKRLQSVTNIFLLSLATSDLLLIIICVPMKVSLLFRFYM